MDVTRRMRALSAVLTMLVLLSSPATAVASCMQPPPLEKAVTSAEIVFVGTVRATTNENRWATVEVEEVWRGPDQSVAVVIKGGPAGNTATSVDRSFEIGVRYLFFPSADPEGGLADTSCSSTTPWTEAMLALRPADARQPTDGAIADGGFNLAGLMMPAAVALVVAVLLLGAGLLARGREEG